MCGNKRLILTLAIVASIGCLGPAATAQPVKSGLVFWLDASKTSALTLSGDKVARWNDLSGNNYYADQTDATLRPTYVRGALSGRAIVDFGDSVYGNPLTTYQPWMQFRDAAGAALNISTIRTVFWVCGMDSGSNGFLLGDDNNYHFHRGTANQIWDGANGWASANIRSGSTYLNGEKVDGTATVLPTDYSIISLVTTANVEADSLTKDRTYRSGGIKLGELLIFDRALTDEERVSMEKYLYNKWFVAGVASEGQPADGETDVVREPMLSWTAGEFAATHDVYFGTTFADVNDAGRDNPMDVLVSQNQEETTFDPGRLEFGTTYYWRVDEVNAAPDYTIFKGSVWQFTTEPYSYPLSSDKITAAASSFQGVMTPERTIDGSGLNASDQHSTDSAAMWTSNGTKPNWIQYTFDKAYMLDTMLVWNSNQPVEPFVGFGAKQVTVEYSTDGVAWTTLENVPQFGQATGQATYAANTTVSFGGAMARYVKLTIETNWGGIAPQTGLSEVRFQYVPVAARQPEPANGTTDVSPEIALSWRAGRQAASHKVFLGTDANNLSLVAMVSEPGYAADLSLGTTYFWKIVEVNEAEAVAEWASDVWTFSTVRSLVVDNFETYTDDMTTNGAIFQTWIDGYDSDDNGSVVGYSEAPFAEQTIVQNGNQSMPLSYDNSSGATYAEATRTFDTPQDWTKHGYRTLSLAFYGDPNNTGQLYVRINNTKIAYNGAAADIKRTQWLPWNIDLASSGASLASVTKLAVGVDGAGAVGTLYFDDIELYAEAAEFVTPVDPGTTGLVAWYKFDGNLKDSAGSFNGTAVGDIATATDATRGQVLSLDGVGDAVEVPVLGTVEAQTIAMWVYSTIDPLPVQFASMFHSDGWAAGDIHWRYTYGVEDSGLFGLNNTTGKSVVKAGQWNHVAITVSATEWAMWLNGYKEGSQALAAPQTMTLGDGLIGAWLGTDGVTIDREFTGKIDDARFYNRALSQEEIASLAGRTEPFAKPF
ncbi:MAG: LamG-like jellyroll fold domain-containing protein [Solirubrobacterales bacterium]